MNCRPHAFDIKVEPGKQIEEATLSILHSIILHRSASKYKQCDRSENPQGYQIGSLGLVEVNCDFVDFTYVRVNSPELDGLLRKSVIRYQNYLGSMQLPASGQVTLEFYQRARASWPFSSGYTDIKPYESWNIKLNVVPAHNENERLVAREQLAKALSEKVIYIASTMNLHEYLPQVPNAHDLDLIFDLSFPNVQPYLFRLSGPGDVAEQSMASTFKKLFQGAMS